MLEEDNQINYIKLSFAICGGILMASLIASVFWIVLLNAAVDSQVTSITNQTDDFAHQMQDLTAKTKREAVERQERQQNAMEQQRIKSSVGKTLARECSEYSKFYRDNPSSYAKQERDKICNKYRKYISSGRT